MGAAPLASARTNVPEMSAERGASPVLGGPCKLVNAGVGLEAFSDVHGVRSVTFVQRDRTRVPG